MSFQKTKSTDGLVIVGPRDTEFTRSDLPTIPPVSVRRGWVRPRDPAGQQVPSSRRTERLKESTSRPRP